MQTVFLTTQNDFAEWRDAARKLLSAGVAPADVNWRVGRAEDGLFDAEGAAVASPGRAVASVKRAYIELAETVINHADPERFHLLYDLLWRMQADGDLMGNASDPVLSQVTKMGSAVRRDSHKMKAFVRFRAVADDSGGEKFAAWFEPDHYSLEMTAPFFVRRFAGMQWAVITPYRSAFWDGNALSFGDGGSKADIPAKDAVEADWQTYFVSIFNPARLKVAMMKSEMPMKYWRNLPEAPLIAPLIQGARAAERDMLMRAATEPPSRHLRQQDRQGVAEAAPVAIESLEALAAGLGQCRRCPLYEQATQPVPGQGPLGADVMFVGEQPGDQEDLAGQPFIGPAGAVFDAALEKVGINRSRVYVTNAVKHFKFTPRGKRRIHQRPDAGEIQACKFWLDHEIRLVQPRLLVALGASAARSLLGRVVTIGKERGRPIDMGGGVTVFVTNHPSYLLRIPDRAEQRVEQEKFEADLMMVAEMVKGAGW